MRAARWRCTVLAVLGFVVGCSVDRAPQPMAPHDLERLARSVLAQHYGEAARDDRLDCWREATVEPPYCMRLAQVRQVEEAGRAVLYVLASNIHPMDESNDRYAHPDPGLAAAFAVVINPDGSVGDVLAAAVALPYGSNGACGCDDATLVRLGAATHAWHFVSGGVWQGIVVTNHVLLARKGDAFTDVSEIPEITEADQSHRLRLRVDGSDPTDEPFPIVVTKEAIEDAPANPPIEGEWVIRPSGIDGVYRLPASAGVGGATGGSSLAPQRFEASGRVVVLEGAECRETPELGHACDGPMRLRIDDQPVLRLAAPLLLDKVPLAVGPVDAALNARSPSIVLADFDNDGREDVAVATSRQGGYGRTAYAIHRRRGDGWVYSSALSALTEARMGLPVREGPWLLAFGKSGCCVHVEERYSLVGGEPQLAQTWTETSLEDGRSKIEVFLGEPVPERRPQRAPPECPSRDFPTFLRAFAAIGADARRLAWSRDPMELEVPAYLELDDARPADTVVREISGEEREQAFLYRWYPQVERFGWEDGFPEADVALVPEIVEREGMMEVTLGRESEIDTYTFKPRDGCWQLVRRRNGRD